MHHKSDFSERCLHEFVAACIHNRLRRFFSILNQLFTRGSLNGNSKLHFHSLGQGKQVIIQGFFFCHLPLWVNGKQANYNAILNSASSL